MVVIEQYYNVGDFIPPAEIYDPIVDGKDPRLLEVLQKTIALQEYIAQRLNIMLKPITIDNFDYTVDSLNKIIQQINRNFAEIEEKLNNVSTSDILHFDEEKTESIFFSDAKKLIEVNISNNQIKIVGENNVYTFDVKSETMVKE